MSLDLQQRLSPHLTLGEVLTTSHREFLAEQLNPPPSVLLHLTRHAADLWEPVRDLVGPMHVNSGYRCWGLNSALGGSQTSVHPQGLATDNVPTEKGLVDAMEAIVAALPNLLCDQVIFEEGAWIHLGSAAPGSVPRRQALMKFRGDRGYYPWNPNDPRVRALR